MFIKTHGFYAIPSKCARVKFKMNWDEISVLFESICFCNVEIFLLFQMFLWGALKWCVNKRLSNDIEHIRSKIEQERQNITIRTIRNVYNNLCHRLEKCFTCNWYSCWSWFNLRFESTKFLLEGLK